MTQTLLGVGIDTARYGHHVSFLDQQQRTASASFHFKEEATGFDKLKKVLVNLAKKNPEAEIRIHLDPAGSYANNLTRFLQTLDSPKVIVSIGRPEANENYRKAIFGKKKADPVESLACARFAVAEKPAPAPIFAPEMESLRRCVSTIEAVAKQKTQTVNQLHAIQEQITKAEPSVAWAGAWQPKVTTWCVEIFTWQRKSQLNITQRSKPSTQGSVSSAKNTEPPLAIV